MFVVTLTIYKLLVKDSSAVEKQEQMLPQDGEII